VQPTDKARQVQILDDKPLEHVKPIVEELLGDKDKNKQRGAAELLAGIIGGKSVVVI
jgi:proteasome activator subunit 4